MFIDPAWGRIEGQEALAQFFVKAMAGLTDTGWITPERWVSVDGHRVIAHWDQVVSQKTDGSYWSVPGISILHYAGEGLFCYEMDMINMAHLGEVLRAMKWRPPAGMNSPPKDVCRDTSLPPNSAHLEKP